MNLLAKIRNLKKFQHGFTLIELLIVVIILGILAAIVTIGVAGARDKSVEKSCKQSALNLSTALDEYYLDNGSYPASYSGTSWISTAATSGAQTTVLSYMKSTPVLVGSGGTHDYWLSVSGTATTAPTITGYSTDATTSPISGCVYPNS